MTPKVSVIVPIYDVEKFLPRCVDSLRNQTLHDIEIVLVDDESPDHCPAMCDEYQKKDSRIKVIHKKNGGLGYARNSGMEVAIGEYIAFVDSDDYIDLDMFENMYRAAKDNNADFVRVDNYKETIDGKILNADYKPPMREGKYNKEELRQYLLYPQFGMLPQDSGDKYVSCSVWRNIYRREIISNLGLRFVSERELISEDIPFNLAFMMECENAYVINRKFYHYIVNDKSLTQTYRPDRFQKELVLYHALEERLKKAGIYSECEIRLQRHLLDRLRMCVKSELLANSDFKQAKINVNTMISCREISHIYKVYSVHSMPLKYKITYTLIKHRKVTLLGLISYFL